MCLKAIGNSDVIEITIAAGSSQVYHFPKNSYLQGKNIIGLAARVQGSVVAKTLTGKTLITETAAVKGYLKLKQGQEEKVNIPLEMLLITGIDGAYVPFDISCVDFERSTINFPTDLVSGSSAIAGQGFELVVIYED